MRALVAADSFAALPTFIWLYLFATMADHYKRLPAYGYSGAWDFWVYFPLVMGMGLIVSIAVCNFLWRKPGVVTAIAALALLPVLPFMIDIGGGV